MPVTNHQIKQAASAEIARFRRTGDSMFLDQYRHLAEYFD